jgi:branched-chain amino acid transport system substrate-binding protein
VLYVSDYYNDVGLIAKQARELGFKGPMVGGDGWDSPDLVKIGGTAVEKTASSPTITPRPTPGR